MAMWRSFKAVSTPDAWGNLLASVKARATMMDSPIHGDKHWRGVALAGMRICDAHPQCDRRVVLAFAMFHDSQRLDDDFDPEHGERAAAEVTKSRALRRTLRRDQIAKLERACAFHEKGQTTDDPTIGACWDADRANLWRVSITPNRRFFSVLTEPQEFRDIVQQMEHDWRNPPSWEQLLDPFE
jgi:uncharacterized protein